MSLLHKMRYIGNTLILPKSGKIEGVTNKKASPVPFERNQTGLNLCIINIPQKKSENKKI